MNRQRRLHLGEDLQLPLDVISRRTAILGQTDTGKTSTAVVMVEEAAKLGAAFAIIDPTDAWWGIASSQDGNGPGVDCVVIGGTHGDVPIDEHAGRIIARLVADEGYSVVLCLKSLGSWSARQRFVADFLSELYEHAARQVLLVVDEAHRFAPQQARDEGGHAARCMGAMIDVVLLGRRQGLGTVVVTQRTARLHKDVLEASEVLIAHRLRGTNDRKALAGWVEDAGVDLKTIMAEVGRAAKGVAYVSAPTMDIGGTFTIRPKDTFDSSKTIELGDVAVEPKARAQVDMAALERHLADTIEKQKENDPKELRTRLKVAESYLWRFQDALWRCRELSGADLSSDVRPAHGLLAAKIDEWAIHDVAQLRKDYDESGNEPEKVIEQIEVPALDDGELEALQTALDELAVIRDSLAQQATEIAGTHGEMYAALTLAKTLRGEVAIELQPARNTDPAPAPTPRTGPAERLAATAPSSDRSSAVAAPPSQNGSGELSKGARGLLEVIERRHPIPLTFSQWCTMAGRSKKSSSVRPQISELERAGMIIAENGKWIAATGSGTPQTREEIVSVWMNALPPSGQRMLQALLDRPQQDYERDELAEASEISTTSSALGSTIKILRDNGLIQQNGSRLALGEALQ